MNNFKTVINNCEREWEYLQNSRIPVIYLGTASCGMAAGAGKVKETISSVLKEKKIKAEFVEVGCIGPCYLEPLMDISLPGGPRISYGNVNEKIAGKIIEKHLLGGSPMEKIALGHFGEVDLPGIGSFFDQPMIRDQTRIVLRNCGIIDPENINHYIARGGYQGFYKALDNEPGFVIDEISKSELRGRGGAGFPTGTKWGIARNSEGDEKFLICNADEGDPGAFMNRSLLEGDPHSVLEGMLIAAYGIGVNTAYIYIRAEYPLAIKRLRIAIEQMHQNNLLGDDILDSGFSLEIKIKEGAGAFVCGEETSLIRSIEGKRGMPNTKPPFPAVSGLYGKPTIINNVETLGTISQIILNGSSWYRQFGVKDNSGTKTFSLVGKVRRTGLIEVALGTSLRKIIFDIGGGTLKSFKAVQTGGPSGGCIPEELLDTPVTYESLASIGSIMGSGGMIVMDSDTCVVDVARYFLDFIQKESCGKCTPCRVGTRHLVEILERICSGEGEIEDIKKLQELGETIKATSLCGLGQTAPNPVITTLKYFRTEFIEHITNYYCPALVCRELIEYIVVPEKCTGCQRCVSVCPTGAITGPRSEPHNLDTSKCVKCRACYEVCRFDAIAGNAIIIGSRGEQ